MRTGVVGGRDGKKPEGGGAYDRLVMLYVERNYTGRWNWWMAMKVGGEEWRGEIRSRRFFFLTTHRRRWSRLFPRLPLLVQAGGRALFVLQPSSTAERVGYTYVNSVTQDWVVVAMASNNNRCACYTVHMIHAIPKVPYHFMWR